MAKITQKTIRGGGMSVVKTNKKHKSKKEVNTSANREQIIIDFNAYEKKRARILSDIRFYSDTLALNEGTPNEGTVRWHLEAAQNALQMLDRMAECGLWL